MKKKTVTKKTKPSILYILEETTKSAFPLAICKKDGAGWVVPDEAAKILSRNLIALKADPANPRMKLACSEERDFQMKTAGYYVTTPNEWGIIPTLKANVKWIWMWMYWSAMKYSRLALYKIQYRAERCRPKK